MATVIINGVTYIGRSISVNNGKVTVDGQTVIPEGKEINISVVGDINELNVDSCYKIDVKGNVDKVGTTSGDVTVNGNAGNVNTVSGDVNVEKDVNGSISTTSGDVSCGQVSGNIKTVSGDIKNKK